MAFFCLHHCCHLINADVIAFVLLSQLRQGNNNATNAAVSASLVRASLSLNQCMNCVW